MVLLPGMDGSGKLFAPFLAELPAGLDVRVMTYPSSLSAIDDLAGYVLSQLGDSELLIAESFSGPIALEVCRRRPDRVAGLVLCATFTSCPNPLAVAIGEVVPGRILKFFGALTPIANWLCFGGLASIELQRNFAQALASLGSGTLKARLRVLRRLNVEFEPLSIPTLVVHPARDRLVSDSASVRLRNGHASAVVIVDGPHFLMQTRPKQCWDAIRAFQHQVIKARAGVRDEWDKIYSNRN